MSERRMHDDGPMVVISDKEATAIVDRLFHRHADGSLTWPKIDGRTRDLIADRLARMAAGYFG